MADRSSSVRVLQHHLRQAGERLSAGDLEAAAAHVDAALAVDPASLAALTLRNRVLRARSLDPAVFDVSRTATAGDAHAEFPSESTPAPRFVPSGVDPQSWMSFEGRIEERRFRSLLKSAHEAVRRRDVIAARIAIEEARDLRPDAQEVSDLSDAIAALPLAVPAADTVSLLRSRTVRAAGMLVFGVTVMLALDWLRSDPSGTSIDRTWALGRAGESDIVASTSRTGTDALRLDRMPGQPAGRIDTPAEPDLVPAAAASVSASRADAAPAAAPAAERTTPAAGARGQAGAGRPAATSAAAPSPSPVPRDAPNDAQNRVIVEAAVTSTPARSNNTAPLPSGEVDDDYVAVPQVTARSTVSAPVPVAPPSTGAATGTMARESSSSGPAANRPLGSVIRDGSTTGVSAGTLVGGARGNTSADAGAATRAGSTSGSAVAPTPAPAAAAVAAAASAAGAVVPRDERNQVMTTVQSYTRALERLDTRAVREVWPTVDERALGRTFTDVESQTFTFSAPCSIDVQGARATASCRGTAKYVVKVGSREPRTEPRTWGFQLTRSGEDWVIDNVRVAR